MYALFTGVTRLGEVQESIPELCTYYMFWLLYEAQVKNEDCIDDRRAIVQLTKGFTRLQRILVTGTVGNTSVYLLEVTENLYHTQVCLTPTFCMSLQISE